MCLSRARLPGGASPGLPPGPPYPCSGLGDWAGLAFDLPPTDPRLRELHDGGPAPVPALENLAGQARAWQEHPEWLDFLDPSAPNHREKLLERELYLHWWRPYLPEGGRVLDLGGGVGRFATWLLDRGLDVELVDPDLRALWRAAQHAAGRPGRVDLHWGTGERLPSLRPVDAVVAAEVLCYAEDPSLVLDRAAGLLRPGGCLFCSVEARCGWAASLDAAPGTLPALLSGGAVHVPGDRWVRTFDEAGLRELLAGWEILLLVPTHYVSSGPFELAAGRLSLPELLQAEEALRRDPVTAPLNRAWTAVARPRLGGAALR